jgi:hypothetical protein
LHGCRSCEEDVQEIARCVWKTTPKTCGKQGKISAGWLEASSSFEFEAGEDGE